MSAESVQASRTGYTSALITALFVVNGILVALEVWAFVEFGPDYGTVSNLVFFVVFALLTASAVTVMMLRSHFTHLAKKMKSKGDIYSYQTYGRLAIALGALSVVTIYSMLINLQHEHRLTKIAQLPEVEMAARDVGNAKGKLEQLIAKPPASPQTMAQAESLQSSLTTEKETLASTMKAKEAQFWNIQDKFTGLQFGEITNAPITMNSTCINKTGNHRTRAKAICNEYKKRFLSNTKIVALEQKLSENQLVLSWLAQKSELQDAIATAEVKYIALLNGKNGEGYPESTLLVGSLIESVTGINAVYVAQFFYYVPGLVVLIIFVWAQSNRQNIIEDSLSSDSRAGGRTFIQEPVPTSTPTNRVTAAWQALKGQTVKPNDDDDNMDFPLVVVAEKRQRKPKKETTEETTSNPIGFTATIEQTKPKPKQALTTTIKNNDRQTTLF
jgi:hypothetical protein